MKLVLFALAFHILIAGLVANFALTPAEQNALVDIYNSLDGPHWVEKGNWMTGDACNNSWFGVSCTTNGHVVGIYLSKNNLVGTIPSSFGNFFNLNTFDMSLNHISGSIPSTIGSLRTLTTITLEYNTLGGSIPNEMGDLLSFSLQNVDFSNNQLTGLVPDFFSNGSSVLHHADLSNNPFICPIPPNCGYTGATCVSWVLSYTPEQCLNTQYDNYEDFPVYGSGFSNLTGLKCRLSSSVDTFLGDAIVVGPNELYCSFKTYPFSKCDGTQDAKTVVHMNLQLISSAGSISNQLQVNVLNTACTFSSSKSYAWANGNYIYTYAQTTSSKYSVYITTQANAVQACRLGLQNYFRCPQNITYTSSTGAYTTDLSTFDLTCTDTDTTCYWAQLGGSSGRCPYYYPTTGVCGVAFTTTDASGTYSTAPCRDFIVHQ